LVAVRRGRLVARSRPAVRVPRAIFARGIHNLSLAAAVEVV